VLECGAVSLLLLLLLLPLLPLRMQVLNLLLPWLLT